MSDSAEELRAFADAYEGNEAVLGMVLSVAKAFSFDDRWPEGSDDDEAVDVALGYRIEQAIWDEVDCCRMLVSCHQHERREMTRGPRGVWRIEGKLMAGGIRQAELERLYMEELERVEGELSSG